MMLRNNYIMKMKKKMKILEKLKSEMPLKYLKNVKKKKTFAYTFVHDEKVTETFMC